MANPKRVVVIGTSAGGLETLRALAGSLPESFPAPICVVMHTSPQSPGVLHEILDRCGPLPAVQARDGERLQPGTIYVAPPDFHLLVEPGRLRVTKGPRENRFRPAVDPLFRSAAQVYGPRAIGVVLTGNLDDGTAGLWAIKQLGGTAIVQDPQDAMFPSMPRHALQNVKADHVVPVAELAPLLVRVTSDEIPVAAAAVPASSQMDIEVKIAKEHNPIDAGLEAISEPSNYACPDCHGVLLKLKEAGRIRFRCHTGHAYSAESLVAAISDGIEESLWVAIRTLEEGALLLNELSLLASAHGHGGNGGARYAIRAEEAHRQSEQIRTLVNNREPLPAGD